LAAGSAAAYQARRTRGGDRRVVAANLKPSRAGARAGAGSGSGSGSGAGDEGEAHRRGRSKVGGGAAAAALLLPSTSSNVPFALCWPWSAEL
jgi:hypothetical protein